MRTIKDGFVPKASVLWPHRADALTVLSQCDGIDVRETLARWYAEDSGSPAFVLTPPKVESPSLRARFARATALLFSRKG